MSKKLSIVTPYYKSLKWTMILANCLIPQLTEEVEWIIVDDGCSEKILDRLENLLFNTNQPKKKNIKVIHLEKNSGNASKPRNIALDNAKGEYVAFIDSDDLIAYNYIEKVLEKINSDNFDYCFMGWRCNTYSHAYIIEEEPPDWNRCVWNCIYRRSIIGDHRFNEEMLLNEDGDFNDRVRKGIRAKKNIDDVLYYYYYQRVGSISYTLTESGL